MHDQSEQYAEFLRGNKALCVLELRKDARTFERALAATLERGQYDHGAEYHIHVWENVEGTEIVLTRDVDTLTRYLQILHYPAAVWADIAPMLRAELGAMFGYDADSCREYNALLRDNPSFCECSKCRGVAHASEVRASE